jgi:hypothetical protein
MKILLTALAGALLLASSGAVAQGMGDGQMGHSNDQRVDHPMNNGDQMHNGDMHRDNRGGHRDSHNMRHHGWNNRHQRCWTTWRHHHRVRVCGWR